MKEIKTLPSSSSDCASHRSAKPSHYDKESEHYDAFNDTNSKLTNKTVEGILKRHGVKTVLDLTCGTGSQILWLAKRGYEVVGSDINLKMLKIARSKTRKEKLDLKFIEGDVRTIKIGKFDAVITIFNAIGHLTKSSFEKAMRNIGKNLKENGLYVFDIINLSYLLKDDRITSLTKDWQKVTGDTIIREIQYSTIDREGILASYTTHYAQKGSKKSKVSRSAQTLQLYTFEQLKEMLQRNGLKVLEVCAIDGSKFDENESERIVMTARYGK